VKTTLYLLNVGHGDSLVLKFEEGDDLVKWGVIDCHKPAANSTSSTLKLLVENNVSNLEFICLTHPDYDHFSGLEELLNYFSDKQKTEFKFYDYGLNVLKITASLSSKREKSEFSKLYGLVCSLQSKNKLEYLPLSVEQSIFKCGNNSVISLGPYGKDTTSFSKQAGKRLQTFNLNSNSKFKDVDKNLLSVVIVIKCESSNIILCSDATTKNIEYSLQKWRNKFNSNYQFDFIKVSHHGSKTNHHAGLFKDFSNHSKSFAGISAGDHYKLPNQEVVSDIIGQEVLLYSTNYSGDLKNMFPFPENNSNIAGIKEYKIEEGLNQVSDLIPPLTPLHGMISFIDDGQYISIHTEYQHNPINAYLLP